MPPPKISHDQIHDAVRRSGYLLEYRIERVLERSGYAPEANEVYPDPVTGKSRELDIAAISPEPITADYRNAIWTRLLIECVNNPQPIGFFVKDPSLPMTIFDLKFSGLPVKIKQKGRWWKISDYLDMEKYHHQCKGKISTQYCSFTPKKNTNPVEWLAQHEDAHFDSFNKLCFALNHEVDEHCCVSIRATAQVSELGVLACWRRCMSPPKRGRETYASAQLGSGAGLFGDIRRYIPAVVTASRRDHFPGTQEPTVTTSTPCFFGSAEVAVMTPFS
jgi:hypothetical protein